MLYKHTVFFVIRHAKTMYKNLSSVILISSFIFSIKGNCQAWNSLGLGVNSNVYAFAVDSVNNELYVGGWFTLAGGIPAARIAKWNGSSWFNVGTGMTSETVCDVRALYSYNGQIYAGGTFDSAGGIFVNNIAKWDGNNWNNVGDGFNSSVFTMIEFNGELYAGGEFDSSGTNAVNKVVKWNGNTWVSVGNAIDNTVLTLCAFNNELYAGGMFTHADGNPAYRVAKWNGTSWESVGVGFNDWVRKLYVYNNELYAGGDFTPIPTNSSRLISKWNGTNWEAFVNPTGGTFLAVRDMINYNGEFYVTGRFSSPSYVGRYNGINYSNLGSGLSGTGGCFTVFNNDLYVGGYFTSVVGVPNTPCLARWSSTTGVFENIFHAIISVYPNPSAGSFAIDLGKTITNGTIQILNTYGESILVDVVTNESKKEVSIYNISSGIYFVKVFDGIEYSCKKIIIM